METLEFDENIDGLFHTICTSIDESRIRVAVSVNSELAFLYWHIGRHISDFVLHNTRAEYGKQIIENLSDKLTKLYGKGWSSNHLRHCLRVAETFTEAQIISATRRQLSWTHLKILAYEANELKRYFYFEMAIAQRLNTRQLENQIDAMLFERTAIAQKPEEQIVSALNDLSENKVFNPDLVFKSSYLLDFLGLKNTYLEKNLEDAIVSNLQNFIMELGNGFAFLERQKLIQIDGVDYHLDLLFYHRKLKRLVAIDLKLGKFKPEFKGQMELYLRWLEKYEMQSDENLPIGLVLCSEGNSEHVELMLLNDNEIKIAQYFIELPDKQWFIDKLTRSVEIAKHYKLV